MTEQNTADREQILDGVRAAIAETLEGVDLDRFDLNALHAGTPMLSLPIDSLALMQIVAGVEDRFRIYISEDSAYSFITVGELIDFVQTKSAAKAARKRS